MLTKAELREAAERIEGILAKIEAGELTGPASYVARLEGAAATLRDLGTPARGKGRRAAPLASGDPLERLMGEVLALDDEDFGALLDLVSEEAERRWNGEGSAGTP